jgi:hypothetical protein
VGNSLLLGWWTSIRCKQLVWMLLGELLRLLQDRCIATMLDEGLPELLCKL